MESDCAWSVRVRVDLDGRDAGTSVLTNVTIPLVLNASRVDLAAAQPDGDDLRITDFGGAVLPFEIEAWTPPTAIVWVRVPSIAPTANGASLFLYFGNPAAAAAPSLPAWDADYVGVWHLGAPSNGVYRDSAGSHHGTATGAVITAPGQLASAARFSGTSFVDVGTTSTLALTAAGTLSAWVRFDAATKFASPIGKTQFGDTPNFSYAFQRNGDATGEMGIVVSNGTIAREANAATPTVVGTWTHFVGRWDAAELRMFVDGVASGPSAPGITAQVSDVHRARIGCSFAPACTSDGGVAGLVDEVRVSRIARSASWIRFDTSATSDRIATFRAPEVR